MGVQCKVLGHVYDATEFEERREDRENGTVLICREYQVCKRCGDHKELYRNEQLIPDGEKQAEESTAAGAGAAEDTAAAEDEAPAEAVERNSDDGESESTQSPASPPSEPDTADADREPPVEETGAEILEADGNGNEDVSEQPDDRDTASTATDQDGAAHNDEAEADETTATESPDAEILSTPADDGDADHETESTPRTASTPQTGSDDREFGEWPEESTDDDQTPLEEHQWPDDADEDTADPTRETSTEQETGTGSAADDGPVTDDAVILTGSTGAEQSPANSAPSADDSREETTRTTAFAGDGGRESTSAQENQTLTGATESVPGLSAFGTDDESDPELRCPNCGDAWTREETSLRDGDLCPGCREDYVEVC